VYNLSLAFSFGNQDENVELNLNDSFTLWSQSELFATTC